jgi:hypothetical protein
MRQLNPEWINRLGIVLNFLAGILMAPDLIGKERLLKLQGTIEQTANYWLSMLKIPAGTEHKYEPYGSSVLRRLILFLVALGFWIIVWYWVLDRVSAVGKLWRIGAILAVPIVVVLLFSALARVHPSPLGYVFWIPVMFVTYVSLYLIWGIPYHGLVLFFLVIPKIMEFTLSQLVRRLEGDNNLSKVLLISGLAVFVLGNLLQLIATFTK